MVGVAGGSEARQFDQRLGAAGGGSGLGFEQERRGALAHDESGASPIEGAARGARIVFETGGERAHVRVRGEVDRIDAVLHPDDEHGIGVAVADPAQTLAEADRPGRAGRRHSLGGTAEVPALAEQGGRGIGGTVDGQGQRHRARPIGEQGPGR